MITRYYMYLGKVYCGTLHYTVYTLIKVMLRWPLLRIFTAHKGFTWWEFYGRWPMNDVDLYIWFIYFWFLPQFLFAFASFS